MYASLLSASNSLRGEGLERAEVLRDRIDCSSSWGGMKKLGSLMLGIMPEDGGGLDIMKEGHEWGRCYFHILI